MAEIIRPIHVAASQDPEDPGYVKVACGLRVPEASTVTPQAWAGVEPTRRCRKKGCIKGGVGVAAPEHRYRPKRDGRSRRLSCSINAEVLDRLHSLAGQQRCSVSALVDLAARQFLAARGVGEAPLPHRFNPYFDDDGRQHCGRCDLWIAADAAGLPCCGHSPFRSGYWQFGEGEGAVRCERCGRLVAPIVRRVGP